MREILFRGKQRLAGGWCEGFLVKTGDHFRISTRNDMISFGVDPETVGQFTGLTDKNGKKIFEGDILALRTRRPHIVKFENGGFVLTGTAIPICHANKFEVIGNIHDNPELLEGGVENDC